MLHTYMNSGGQPENWQFTLSANGPEDAAHSAADLEEVARHYLQRFQGCMLPQTPPFDSVDATPQSIAEHFWEPLYQRLKEQGYELVSMKVEQSDGTMYTRRPTSIVCRQAALVPQQIPQPQVLRREHICAQWILSIFLLALCTVGLAFWVWQRGGGRPMGQNIWEHLYRGDFTGYHSSFFSLFSSPAPLPYGIYTLFLRITGSVPHSYFALVILLYGMGIVGWMLWSGGKERVLLSAALAVAWFVSPPMLHIVFVQGNLPVAFCLAGTPYLLYGIYEFLECRKLSVLYGIAICVFCMILSSPPAAAVIFTALVVFLLFHGLMNREWKKLLAILAATCGGVLLSCFWLVPAIQYGQVVLTEDVPIESILETIYSSYTADGSSLYIGIAIFGVAVFGGLCSNWRRAAGFWTAAVCAVVLVFLQKSLLLMMGMAALLGLVSAALLRWRPCSKWVLLACAALLLVDGTFAYYGTQPWTDVQQTVALPQEMQQQQVSALGDVTPEDGTHVIQNRSVKAAQKQHLDEAFEAGHYYYVFDRSLEGGAGTVMMDKNKVPENWVDKLMDAATKSGYQYQRDVQGAYVFYRETPAQFGTTATYQALGIGTTAYYASWLFPSIQEGNSPYPEEYSVEELSRYQTIYLSGWKVHDQQALEALLNELAERKVRVVAEAGTGPELFGTQTEEVMLTGTMPSLSGKVDLPALPLKMLARGITLENLDEAWIWSETNDGPKAVAGTCGPVRLIGLQLTSYTAKESRVEYLPVLEAMLEMKAGTQPQREVIETVYQRVRGTMMIQAAQRGVILPLAYEGPVSVCMGQKTQVHGLLRMQTDILVLQASYSPWGAALTGVGILLIICCTVWVRKKRIPPREIHFVKFDL